jgi:hypothetical protein
MHMTGIRLSLSTLCLLLATPLAADEARMLVGMHIAGQRQDLDFGSETRETRIDSLDIYWYERLNSRIEGGLLLGYQEITQTTNPIEAGQALSGEYLGITLRVNLLQASHLAMFTDFKYRYSSAGRSLSGQDIDWRWHEGQVELGLELALGQSLALTAGAGARRISGRETATGTVSAVTSFDSTESAYARGGLRLLLDRYSHVGIEGNAGAIKGAHIYFQRYF